ncbi:hypothetical protein J6590_028935 [Homalodisca vitripennis]|nr:hypothetical protein J6590_028935 [Homalodisca vitripennis]
MYEGTTDGRESPCVRAQAIHHMVILPAVCISRDTLLSGFLAAISDTQLGNIRNQYISIEQQNVRGNHRWTGEPLCPSASHPSQEQQNVRVNHRWTGEPLRPSASHPSQGNPTCSLHIT